MWTASLFAATRTRRSLRQHPGLAQHVHDTMFAPRQMRPVKGKILRREGYYDCI
jgi:hypothetical protein